MDWIELDRYLRHTTPREQYYLDNPGAPSPRFRDMEKRMINGREVLVFQIPSLWEDAVHLRKDSRFTDVPFHIHTNVNVIYIYSGKCELLVEDTPVILRRGDVGIFDVDVVRRKLYLGGDDIVINFNMTHEFFSGSFMRRAGEQNILSDFMLHVLSTNSPTHDHYILFRTGEDFSVDLLFRMLLTEYYKEDVYRKEMIQGCLRLIFLELLRLCSHDSSGYQVQISSTHSRDVAGILHYLERHSATCTLPELAEQFGYHPKYISTLLKQMTGSSFKQIQTRLRLQNAAELLLQTGLPIQEISQQVGMGNLSHFYAAFEKQFGLLPNAYRHQK